MKKDNYKPVSFLPSGLVDYPSRKAIYTSFTAFNFNNCPLVYFLTRRESIDKIDHIQERVFRFFLKEGDGDVKLFKLL